MRVQLRKQKPFCKASATFIGRLICLDMQGYQWMKNAWEDFMIFFPLLSDSMTPNTKQSFGPTSTHCCHFVYHLCRRKKEFVFALETHVLNVLYLQWSPKMYWLRWSSRAVQNSLQSDKPFFFTSSSNISHSKTFYPQLIPQRCASVWFFICWRVELGGVWLVNGIPSSWHGDSQ